MTDRIDGKRPTTFSSQPKAERPTDVLSGPVPQRPTAEAARRRGADTFLGWTTNANFPYFWRGAGCADAIGWLAREYPPGPNVTQRFNELNAAARVDKQVLPDHASDFEYLCIGGIFSHHFPDALYMQENIDALVGAGLSARRVAIDSTNGVEANAKVVRDAVMRAARSGKKVVLIGHSKGGLDAAAAIAKYPEVAELTHALITMQSPYGGSPVAQDIASDPLQWGLSKLALGLIDGKKAMARDLTYDARRKFVAEHPLPANLNIVSLATTDQSLMSSLALSNRYIRDRYRKKSDGVVCEHDALLPNSRYVIVSGVDHMKSIGPSFPRGVYTPASITLSLVALALEKR